MMAVMTGEQWRVWAARVSVVAGAAVVVVSLNWLWGYANTDNPTMIEDPLIVRVANAACATMRDEAAAAAVGTAAPRAQRVGAINAQNDAVIELVATVRRFVDPGTLERDQPSEQWLEDWQRLVAVRDAYARSLAAGKPAPMVMPVIDGQSLTDRLDNVGLNCRVPLVILEP
jgi:hypothetical protein